MGEKAGLDAIESASRDELESLQMRWLEWSLRHAYENVPAYRRKCEAWQIHPDDLRAVDDLARFPFTTKDDLRAAYPFGMFAVPREAVVRVHASSGTTGHPTVVGYTEDDLETWAQLVARSIYAAGGRRPARAISCTTPMATACSRAGWGFTAGPSDLAARACRFRGA